MCFSYVLICKKTFFPTQYFTSFNVVENIYKKYKLFILICFI